VGVGLVCVAAQGQFQVACGGVGYTECLRQH
jgi:hypothetical protein